MYNNELAYIYWHWKLIVGCESKFYVSNDQLCWWVTPDSFSFFLFFLKVVIVSTSTGFAYIPNKYDVIQFSHCARLIQKNGKKYLYRADVPRKHIDKKLHSCPYQTTLTSYHNIWKLRMNPQDSQIRLCWSNCKFNYVGGTHIVYIVQE